MLARDDSPVHGRVDREGRLVTADAALADLHARAGGEKGGPLAVPQLAAVARLARRLAIPISRAVLAADGDEDLDLWVRARPDEDGVAITIDGWIRNSAAAPLSAPSPDLREVDFVRAEADWIWEVDAALRLVVAVVGRDGGAGRRWCGPCARRSAHPHVRAGGGRQRRPAAARCAGGARAVLPSSSSRSAVPTGASGLPARPCSIAPVG